MRIEEKRLLKFFKNKDGMMEANELKHVMRCIYNTLVTKAKEKARNNKLKEGTIANKLSRKPVEKEQTALEIHEAPSVQSNIYYSPMDKAYADGISSGESNAPSPSSADLDHVSMDGGQIFQSNAFNSMHNSRASHTAVNQHFTGVPAFNPNPSSGRPQYRPDNAVGNASSVMGDPIFHSTSNSANNCSDGVQDSFTDRNTAMHGNEESTNDHMEHINITSPDSTNSMHSDTLNSFSGMASNRNTANIFTNPNNSENASSSPGAEIQNNNNVIPGEENFMEEFNEETKSLYKFAINEETKKEVLGEVPSFSFNVHS
ncbi:hypothetical protein NEIRO02_1485 [Nematocida sp. AWRm79]|nr:hypothetical protein NEIRO02_1485 [Nematocida sp. AWRm79]